MRLEDFCFITLSLICQCQECWAGSIASVPRVNVHIPVEHINFGHNTNENDHSYKGFGPVVLTHQEAKSDGSSGGGFSYLVWLAVCVPLLYFLIGAVAVCNATCQELCKNKKNDPPAGTDLLEMKRSVETLTAVTTAGDNCAIPLSSCEAYSPAPVLVASDCTEDLSANDMPATHNSSHYVTIEQYLKELRI